MVVVMTKFPMDDVDMGSIVPTNLLVAVPTLLDNRNRFQLEGDQSTERGDR